MALLVWAVAPPRRKLVSADEVLTALSEEHHSCRLPKIVQALHPEDTAFLAGRGFAALRKQVRAERGRIALMYLDALQQEYDLLLEVSRVVAAMVPELIAVDEAERFKLHVRFALVCGYLRWKLRLGLEPWGGFKHLTELSSGMALHLEVATTHIGERAAQNPEYSSILDEGDNGPQ